MAKRKEETPPAGAPAWMATFSDLMNLLLCFFVILFAMSTVDEDKFEQLAASLAASFGIMEGGSASVLDGNMVSSGISQLNNLNDLYTDLGLNTEANRNAIIKSMEDYKEVEQKQLLEASSEIAEQVKNMIVEKGISDQIEIDIEAQYVQLTLNGALLFDSGQASVKNSSLEFLNKVGDILKVYEESKIEVIGHTDNVPIYNDPKYDDNWTLSFARARTVVLFLQKEKGLDITKLKGTGCGEYEPIAPNDTSQGRAQNRRVEIKIYNEIYSNY